MTAARQGTARSVSIIVPTYREVENVSVLIDRVKSVASAHGWDIEMLIVDDRSDDGTASVVEALGEGDWLRVIIRDGERSLSWAVIEGLRRATHDTLVVMDADLSHPPEAIPRLVEALREPGVDFVFGSRFVRGGATDPGWTAARRLNSLVARLLARPLISLRDPTSGFFALSRARFLAADELAPIGYKIGLELLVKCGCRNIREVPIRFSVRLNGKTKLGLTQRLQYIEHLRRLWAYRVRKRIASAVR